MATDACREIETFYQFLGQQLEDASLDLSPEQSVQAFRAYQRDLDQLRKHLGDFVAAYNFARRLKTLRGLTPYEAICKAWTDQPARFISNPHHQLPGPNI